MSADGALSTPRQHILGLADELIVDLFAGGGGMSTAIEMALGRHVDISANHSEVAVSMHRVNHPQTKHFKADVFEVDPRAVTRGRKVGLVHMSPDCTHFSQAKGGQHRSAKIRGLSWVGVRWVGQVRPRALTMENVKQIQTWGPLIAKRDPATGRVLTLDMVPNPADGRPTNRVADVGERVPVQNQYLVPDPRHIGRTWARFIALLRGHGYVVEYRMLVAADFGAPTSRERLFLVARCDGLPIEWPEPTHFKTPKKGQKKWRAAAECIDWSIPCPSIFERRQPLKPNTLKRIARGLKRYVIDADEPFIVPVTHTSGSNVHSTSEPLRTITTAKGGELALVAPTLIQAAHGEGRPGGVKRWGDGVKDIREPVGAVTASGGSFALSAATLVQTGYGERKDQQPRSLDVDASLGPIVAGDAKQAAVVAFMAQHNTMPKDGVHAGHGMREPVSTVTKTGSQQGLVAASVVTLRGDNTGSDLSDPLRTMSAGGQHQALVEYQLAPEHEAGALRVAALLVNYYGNGQPLSVRDPLDTITTRDRLALVTVTIRGAPYVIVDIGLRMLKPRELYNAQGFPPNYIIDRGDDGRRLTGEQQVRMVGNSVSPPPGAALIAANFKHELVAADRARRAA